MKVGLNLKSGMKQTERTAISSLMATFEKMGDADHPFAFPRKFVPIWQLLSGVRSEYLMRTFASQLRDYELQTVS